MVAILAELESGAVDDLAAVVTLDPEPYCRSVEAGQGQIDLVQEATKLVDIGDRQTLENHGAIIGDRRYGTQMPAEPDKRALVEFVSTLVGSPLTEFAPLPGSVANLDYLARTADQRRFIVKIGPRSEMVAEAWACRRLAPTEVPVPEIVHLEPGYDGPETALLIVSFLSGAASAEPSVVEAAGRAMRRVHAERFPGWGPLVVDADGSGGDHARGCFRTWPEAVVDSLSGLPELVAAGIIEAQLANAARKCVEMEEVLGYQGPGVLLHNDLKSAHLFAVEDEDQVRLSGIIDWGDAGVGDPLVDLARLSMSGPEVLDAFAAGYGVELTPLLHRTLARYRILRNVTALTYEYRAGGDWFDVYRDGVSRDTGLLAGSAAPS